MSSTTSMTPDTAQPRERSAALLGFVSEGFFSQLSFGVVAFTLPLYARQMGLSVAEIGILLSLNVSVAVALKPFTGWVADWVGYKRGAMTAISLRSLLALLFAVAGSPLHLYAIQAARGVAKALRDPAMHALIADHGGNKTLATSFAWYQTAKGTAGPCGRALAGVLLTATASNFHWVFAVATALSVLPLITLSFWAPQRSPKPEQHSSPRQVTPDAQGAERAQSWTALAPFVGFGFLISSTAHMLHGLMPLLLVEYAGLNEAQAGFLYLVSALVALVAPLMFGWLHDHVSRELVLMTRSITNVVSSVLYLSSSTLVGFTLAKVLDKLGTAAFQPAWATLMAEVSAAEPAKRAQRIGVMSAGEDAGTIAGPILAGCLWSAWGVLVLMSVRIALALASEVYTFFLMRSMAQTSRAQANTVPQPSESSIVAH